MKRPATKIVVAAVVVGVAIIGISGARFSLREAACGPGFVRLGARCCASSPEPGRAIERGVCLPDRACPSPLVLGARGCEAPLDDTVLVPAVTVTIGPSDWEAEGRVAPRLVKTSPFRIDRFEVTVAAACSSRALAGLAACTKDDSARAISGVALSEARAYCKERGGRLPTEDEWLAAAAGDKPRRYPWGDTGAVCRRAAWGLLRGPCGDGAEGPDTVGAHPDGATPLGIHDLAGNVAEWVETGACPAGAPMEGECIAVVRGGAWDASLATELRTWLRREVSSTSSDRTIGLRCAYDAR